MKENSHKEISQNDLAVMIANGFNGMDGRFDRVEERLDRVEDRLDRVEERLDRVEDRLDKVEVRLGNVEKQVTLLRLDISELKPLKDRVADLEKKSA